MELNEAIYKIRSKEKMIKADFEVGSGDSKEYLEGLIREALATTKRELNKQDFPKAEAKGIHAALSTMPVIKILDTGEAVATFPEYKMNELHIHSVAIKLKVANESSSNH